MKKFTTLLFLKLTLFTFFSANASQNLLIEKLVEQIQQLHKCSTGQLWPDYSLTALDTIYLYDDLIEQTHVLDLKSGQRSLLSLAETPSFALRSYSYEQLAGKNIASFNPSLILKWASSLTQEQKQARLLSLVTHEIFHFIGQDFSESSIFYQNLPSVEYTQQFPYDYRPRYYRRMQVIHLYQAMMAMPGKVEESLSLAAYWFDKYMNEYSGEFSKKTYLDIIEGSADFVEIQSESFIHNQCQIDLEIYQNNLKKNEEIYLDEEFVFSERYESYALGQLALAIDRFQLNNKNRVIQNATEGKNIVFALLENQLPRVDTDRIKLREQTKLETEKKNNKVKGLLQIFRDSNQKFISLNIVPTGSYSMREAFSLSAEKYGLSTIVIGKSALYQNDYNRIQTFNLNLFGGTRNACGDYQDLIPVEDQVFDQLTGAEVQYKDQSIALNLSQYRLEGNLICVE